MTTETEIPSYR